MTRCNPASGVNWLDQKYLQRIREFLRISILKSAFLREIVLNRLSRQFGTPRAEKRRLYWVWLVDHAIGGAA
jgi:hypothetical protein